LRDKREY